MTNKTVIRRALLLILLLPALTAVVTHAAPSLTLTVNGSSTAITVAPGATTTVGAQNGPGNLLDWVGLYHTGAPESGYVAHLYLNGSTSASLPFTLPGTPGTYEFRFFSNNSYTRIATSPTVTVQSDAGLAVTVNSSSIPIALAPGSNVTVGVQNGPGNLLDWVGLYQAGAPETGYVTYLYLNGSTSASLPFTLPGTPGTYEFRFFSNNGYTRIATSPTVTASSGPAPPPPDAGSFYVSSGMGSGAQAAGDDDNPGTLAQPFKTLQKAVSMLRAGGTLVVRGGEYDTVNGLTTYGGATSIPSGTSWDSPTTLQAYPGEKPVFRRYMPAGARVDEITYRDSWHMPTYPECVEAGLPNDFPHGCWDGGTTGPQEQSAYAGQGPDGYVLQFSNDFPNPAQYIVIDGIDIDARGISNMITFYAAFHIRFQNLELRNSIKSGVSQPGLNDESLQTDLQFINVHIHHVGVPYDTNMISGMLARNHPSARFRHAWYMHTGGNSLIGSEISHAAGTALQPAGDNNVIVGNYFHDNNMGVYIDGNNWRICNNVFYNNGMIELYHRSRGTNNTICNNTLVSGPPNPYYARWGIYLSGGSAGSLYENNIIVSPTGVMNNTVSVHTFRNNLIKSTPRYEYSEEYGVPVTKENNILGQDPKLVNPAGGDFRLQAGSPAINKGYPNGLTTDRTGTGRNDGIIDIGAHEFGN